MRNLLLRPWALSLLLAACVSSPAMAILFYTFLPPNEAGQTQAGCAPPSPRRAPPPPRAGGLPRMAAHPTYRPGPRPAGSLSSGVATATNSGAVGPDTAQSGWLKRFPQLCDVPPVDIT